MLGDTPRPLSPNPHPQPLQMSGLPTAKRQVLLSVQPETDLAGENTKRFPLVESLFVPYGHMTPKFSWFSAPILPFIQPESEGHISTLHTHRRLFFFTDSVIQ